METKSKTKQAATEKKELIIHRVFNLPVRKVWQAWTEPESYKKWWGPKDYTCPSATIDFKTGGKHLSCMRSSKGEEIWSTGVYKEIVPHKKIVMSDNFSDDKGNIRNAADYNMPGEWPNELLITLNFEEADGATKMKLKHTGIPDEMYDDCIKGWNESFDKLEKNSK